MSGWAVDLRLTTRRSLHRVIRRAQRWKGNSRAKHVGWVPFLLVIASIIVFAGAGITWVTSPYWHKTVTAAPSRNVGIVPVKATAVSPVFVSPIRIEIPALQVAAPIVDVVTVNGALDVPLNPKIVGWWKYGAAPGATKGTAILDGHINYAGVEGVLSRIGTLNPGDAVYIWGFSHGKKTRLAFTITGVRTYSKERLPYQQIFDQQSIGRLAIVTCGGPFDASTGNYRDNIVAFAVPAATPAPAASRTGT
jgi:hypothetical protein